MTQARTQERIQRMLSPERQERLDVTRIMSLVPLRPHMSIADIGCGPGYFTIPFAKFLWGGKVYAIDTDQTMLDAVQEQMKQWRMGNIVTMTTDGKSAPLEDASVDGVMLSGVLHEQEDKEAFVAEASRILRKSGWLAIIERRPESTTDGGPPAERRLSMEQTEAMATAAGLRVTLRRELSDWFYLVLLVK